MGTMRQYPTRALERALRDLGFTPLRVGRGQGGHRQWTNAAGQSLTVAHGGRATTNAGSLHALGQQLVRLGLVRRPGDLAALVAKRAAPDEVRPTVQPTGPDPEGRAVHDTSAGPRYASSQEPPTNGAKVHDTSARWERFDVTLRSAPCSLCGEPILAGQPLLMRWHRDRQPPAYECAHPRCVEPNPT